MKSRIATQLTLTGLSSRVALERLEAGEHLWQGVTAGHLEEAVARERVERDVDAPQPGGRQLVGHRLEQVAVGRQRTGPRRPSTARQHRDQRRDARAARAARRRSGARPSTPISASRRTRRSISSKVRISLAVEPGQPLGRHAVLAAEVAAVGDRHPQVGDRRPCPSTSGSRSITGPV